jgi:hypothetical protein
MLLEGVEVDRRDDDVADPVDDEDRLLDGLQVVLAATGRCPPFYGGGPGRR